MSEMNTPKDSRTVLSEKLDGIISTDPKNALASALKEALPGLTAAQAEQILNRLNNELPTSKGEEITHAPQGDRVAKLIEALRDEDPSVRGAAAEALVKIGSPAVPQLIEALKDEGSYVRWAARALGEIKDPRAVPQLIEALKDEVSEVREWAAGALVSIGSPAVPHLNEALKDKDKSVRQGAAYALGKIGDKSAITPLKEQLARDGHSWIRSDLIDAIQKLEGN